MVNRTVEKGKEAETNLIALLLERIREIESKGFGEVTGFIRNGKLYRIKSTYEDYDNKG